MPKKAAISKTPKTTKNTQKTEKATATKKKPSLHAKPSKKAQ